MTCTAEIIADSVGPNGVRLTTFLLEYPRIIHSEVMTHRMFSRNASSSRAIPFDIQVERIKNDMFVPIEFQHRHNGMQGSGVFSGWRKKVCEALWVSAGHVAIKSAQALDKVGVSKQLCNRILEPFSHIKVVVTATEWKNFFGLRNHPDAEIHIQELAKKIVEAYDANEPTVLQEGYLHLPFITEEDAAIYNSTTLIKMSVARCARTSYYDNIGKNDVNNDIKLYDRLVGSDPKHASPTEHQAIALSFSARPNTESSSILAILGKYPGAISYLRYSKGEGGEFWSGNLRGWVQYRKMLPNENLDDIVEEKEDIENTEDTEDTEDAENTEDAKYF